MEVAELTAQSTVVRTSSSMIILPFMLTRQMNSAVPLTRIPLHLISEENPTAQRCTTWLDWALLLVVHRVSPAGTVFAHPHPSSWRSPLGRGRRGSCRRDSHCLGSTLRRSGSGCHTYSCDRRQCRFSSCGLGPYQPSVLIGLPASWL